MRNDSEKKDSITDNSSYDIREFSHLQDTDFLFTILFFTTNVAKLRKMNNNKA